MDKQLCAKSIYFNIRLNCYMVFALFRRRRIKLLIGIKNITKDTHFCYEMHIMVNFLVTHAFSFRS